MSPSPTTSTPPDVFEQLRAQLATAVYDSTWHQQQIGAVVNTPFARIAALGVNLDVPAPAGAPGSLSDACMLAGANLPAGSPARDLLAQLAGQLGPDRKSTRLNSR